MIEKLKLTIADGNYILGYIMLPVYWCKHIGRDDIKEAFNNLSPKPYPDDVFSMIKEKKRKWNKVLQEHFILRRKGDGEYTIEDRNNPPMTYLNNKLVDENPVRLKPGDVITIPLLKEGKTVSCFIQVNFENIQELGKPFRQLVQCSKTKQYFIVQWEQDPATRYHFSTSIEKVSAPRDEFKPHGYKSLKMAASTPCPYCGNESQLFCPNCNTFLCYDGISETFKCPNCKKKYKLKDMVDNIDIQTI